MTVPDTTGWPAVLMRNVPEPLKLIARSFSDFDKST